MIILNDSRRGIMLMFSERSICFFLTPSAELSNCFNISSAVRKTEQKTLRLVLISIAVITVTIVIGTVDAISIKLSFV
jgi:hypothetical protein